MSRVLRVVRPIFNGKRTFEVGEDVSDGVFPASEVVDWLKDGTLREIDVPVYRADSGQFTADVADDADGKAEEFVPTPEPVKCPTCGASGDEPCRSKKGKTSTRWHAARKR